MKIPSHIKNYFLFRLAKNARNALRRVALFFHERFAANYISKHYTKLNQIATHLSIIEKYQLVQIATKVHSRPIGNAKKGRGMMDGEF